MRVALADIDHVLPDVGGQHEERLAAAADPQPLALADRIEMGPVVLADLLAVAHGVAPRLGQCRKVVGSHGAGVFRPVGPYLVDVALPGRELLLQKNRQVDLADEADALRILAPGRSQVLLFGDAPHLGLGKPPDGEKRPRQLLLRQLAEEIALILVAVDTRQQADTAQIKQLFAREDK